MLTRLNSVSSKIFRRDRLGVVCAGALITAALSGLSAASAASTPNTITTCTNIKTNVMRLLTKGVCNKKTEKTLVWVPKISTSTASGEQPNKVKYSEYLSDVYLGKMAIGKIIGKDGFPTRTNIFTTGTDLFCTMMTVKKNISAGHTANSIYDVVAKKDNQSKAAFPGELKAGGSGGCSSMDQPVGKYEDRIYIDDVLVVVLPFEVR